MPIYSYKRENGAADMIFFSPKDAQLIFKQLQKRRKDGEKSLRVLTGSAKNEMLGCRHLVTRFFLTPLLLTPLTPLFLT